MATEWHALVFDDKRRMRRTVYDIVEHTTSMVGRIKYKNTVVRVRRDKGDWWRVDASDLPKKIRLNSTKKGGKMRRVIMVLAMAAVMLVAAKPTTAIDIPIPGCNPCPCPLEWLLGPCN